MQCTKQRPGQPLQWRHNKHDSGSSHQLYDCLINRLFNAQIKETSKPRVTGLWAGNSPVTGEFPAQRASNAENVSIWWRHHVWIPECKCSFMFWFQWWLSIKMLEIWPLKSQHECRITREARMWLIIYGIIPLCRSEFSRDLILMVDCKRQDFYMGTLPRHSPTITVINVSRGPFH